MSITSRAHTPKTPAYFNKRAKPLPNKFAFPTVHAQRHFATQERLGLNSLWHCWCGASLELNYVKPGMILDDDVDAMTAELNAFCDAHETCQPKQEEE